MLMECWAYLALVVSPNEVWNVDVVGPWILLAREVELVHRVSSVTGKTSDKFRPQRYQDTFALLLIQKVVDICGVFKV